MNSEEEKRCPLCAEEMDWTDQQLNPCKCGYQVCVWCWHHIMDMAEKDETEGRCPACRTPYDKDRIVGLESNFQRVTTNTSNRKQKVQKPKPKQPEVRKDLSNVRVIQRKMAYIIGLPVDLADEDLLQRKDYFGQYGKVTKISLSRTAGGALQQFVNDTCSVYITYSKEQEAVTCIQAVHGYILDGMLLRASFGTAKYCHAWLRNITCNNPGCLYLHTVGAEEDSFGKDEVAAVHTRNRVQEIVGGTRYPHRRSGRMLPPPVTDQLHNPNYPKVPLPSPDPIKSSPPQNITTFVDIVGRGSSNTSSNKDVNSVQDEDGDDDEEEEDDDDDEEEEAEEEEEEEEEEEDKLDSVIEELDDGYNEMKFENLAKSDRIYRGSNSFSNEEIVEHLRRLEVNDDVNSADVESSIIANILSIDLDGSDNSVPGLFEAKDGRHHSDQSRFSFANQQTDIGYKAQCLTPPGFSMLNKPPPPGFSCMRSDQAVAPTLGSYFRSMPNSSHYRTPSFGNLSNSSDDVGGGKSWTNGLTNSWPSSCSTSFDDDSKHWSLNFMPPPSPQQQHQQQPPSHDDFYGGLTSLHHPSLYTQQQPPKRNEVERLGSGGGGFESFLPSYGDYVLPIPNPSSTRVFGM